MSNDDDLFSAFESERTVIKPSAGRAPRPAAPAADATGTQPAAPAAAAPLPELPPTAGINPLLQAAMPLLRAAPRIRSMPQHPNPAALRASLVEGVRQFEAAARAQGLPNEQVVAGRYALCTLLDECASSTPWGGSGAWSSHSLLVLFHNESWGGEKVFQLMSKLAQDVPRHRNLLELMYALLALGFEGRYRVIDNGRAQLDSVRERLAQLLQKHTPTVDKELSPHWVGAPAGDARLRDGLPVWVVAAGAALLLTLVFVGLRLSLSSRSDATFEQLQALDVPKPAAPTPPAPAPAPRLAAFLQPEIAAGQVEVHDLADRSVVVIRGDGFFEPGSADVASRVRPLLDRIGQALAKVPGQVLIAGYTDNIPIRSLRYPSNWQLSKDRADTVKTLLAGTVAPERLRAEGRADSDPVASNATPAGRAQNRRVEITLFTRG
jgi:type VI secretion system protein ImpK